MAVKSDVLAALAEVLAQHGPLHKDDVVQRLQERGVPDSDSALQWNMLEIDCPTSQLVDDRWVWLPTLLAGRVFTHRVGPDELAFDMLTETPDLDPITALCEHEQYQRLADGSAVQTVVADYDDDLLEELGIPPEALETSALLLERGTLAGLGVAEGDVIGVRLAAGGLVVERIDTFGESAAGERLAATLDAEEPTFIDAAVWTACVGDPALFTEPLPPLSEIVEESGLAHSGEWLAPGGFDFERWRFEGRCELLARRHELDPDEAAALASLIALYDVVSLLIQAPDGDEASAADESPEIPASDLAAVAEFGAALADPLLAHLLVSETVDSGRGSAAALGLFAEMLESKVPRPARVGCRWLRAVALERIGDIAECERELLAAESMDPDWPLTLISLAGIAADRGDAERGLGLLRRAGAEEHPLAELLEAHRPEARRDLGRNEPCWCGSGRKYKKCHLGHEQLPLAKRVGWLYAKAIHHAVQAGWHDMVLALGYERYGQTHAIDDALDEGMNDPLVLDVVLFEGGAFADFLEVRGSLLPDDERLLAAQWLLTERSVFEVEQVRPGRSVTVRNVRTGDIHEVSERTASGYLKPGHLICAHVLPAGDSMQFFGGVEPVALHQRDLLIELLDSGPDPIEVVAELSRRFAPPTLTNTEGDPTVICEATVHVENPDTIEAALDDTYERSEGDEPPRWHEDVETHGTPRIRATLVLEGDRLRVETNSEERMDRVLRMLSELDSAMQVLDESRRPMRDAREAAALAEQMPAAEGILDPDDPEVAEMLEEFLREYEAKWLDEPIPALKGYTPRQAADDPTRRGDLIKLLDSFPAEDAPGRMNANRLRRTLDLE